MASCPFCGSRYYDEAKLECHGECKGQIKEKMYCPADNEIHTFTILGRRLGCWNENCPKRIYSSRDEYNDYDRYERGPSHAPVTQPVVIPQVVKEKEIRIREVVMIPCQYCGVLMPQTATFCPNCGAQRRA